VQKTRFFTSLPASLFVVVFDGMNSHRRCDDSAIMDFYPRDAMLARSLLSSCVRVRVRLSVCHTPVLYQNG